jgi:hypothetical protein
LDFDRFLAGFSISSVGRGFLALVFLVGRFFFTRFLSAEIDSQVAKANISFFHAK